MNTNVTLFVILNNECQCKRVHLLDPDSNPDSDLDNFVPCKPGKILVENKTCINQKIEMIRVNPSSHKYISKNRNIPAALFSISFIESQSFEHFSFSIIHHILFNLAIQNIPHNSFFYFYGIFDSQFSSQESYEQKTALKKTPSTLILLCLLY